MLFSEQHKFIYIHVGRTGGSNMERALKPYCLPTTRTWFDKALNKCRWHWDYRRFRFRQHDGADVAARVLPPEVFANCFKFGIVRNPWDWLVSHYLFLRRKESHRHHKGVLKMSFPQYVNFEVQRDARHQHRLVMDRSGRMLVDYLGRFEELESSFDFVCTKLNIPRPPLERISVLQHSPYQEFYDEELREKVRRHWQSDISVFGYDFDRYEPGEVVENFYRRTMRQAAPSPPH